MKNKLLRVLLAISIWLAPVFVLVYMYSHFITDTETDIKSMRLSMLFEYLLVFISGSWFYWLWVRFFDTRLRALNKSFRHSLKGLFYLIAFLGVYFVYHLFSDTAILYFYSVMDGKKLNKTIYKADRYQGYSHKHSTEALINYPSGKLKVVTIDSSGFRIGLSGLDSPAKTLLLLGCSYTFGDGVSFEESFAGYLQNSSNYRVVNAGVNGYGLAHMQNSLPGLLASYKPDYIVVQYSPWLAIRAVNRYAPALSKTIAVPYFTIDKDMPVLHAADFYVGVMNFNFARYINTRPQSFGQHLKLFIQIACDYWPFCIHDYINKLVYDFKFLLFINKQVNTTAGLRKMEEDIYRNMANQCKRAGVPMLVLAISDPSSQALLNFKTWQIPDVYVVNADSVLNAHIELSKNYYQMFGLYDKAGNDSLLVDYHPNAFAHQLMGQAISSAIEQINTESSN